MKRIIVGGMAALLALSEPASSITTISSAATQTKDINAVISLKLNGGKLPEDAKLVFDSQAETILPVPSKEGYSFAGWYDNEEFSGTAITVLPAGSVQSDSTYYAKWESIAYSIEFVTCGGVIDEDVPKEYVTGTELQLPDKVTKENYNFAGWYDNPEYTGNVYTSIMKTDIGNLTFYAKWEIKGYKVTLNLNGGNLPEGTELTFEIGKQAVLPIPTRENYIFAGWYDNEALSGSPIAIIAANDYGDRSLYAKWLAEECTIVLNLNGGSLSEGTEIVHSPGTITQLPIPIYDDFVFGGWYNNAAFSGEAVSFIPADASGNITYYAKWIYKEPSNGAQTDSKSQNKVLPKGTLATFGKMTYKVSNSKKHTVTLVEAYNVNTTIPATIKLSGVTYKVTAISEKAFKLNAKVRKVVIGKNIKTIGKYAFDRCKNLKNITVKSKCLSSIGKKALRGIASNCCISVPKSKFKTYKKLFKGKGQADTVKIKRN